MNSASRRWLRALLPAALVLCSLQAAAQAVGRVLIAACEVSVARAGRESPLATGAEILNGDMIITGEASSAQLRFTDHSLVALRAKSRFHVADYRFGGTEDAGSSAVFALLQGGLRTLSGLIGRTQPDRYRMRTPLATVGIRGTAYALVHCQGDCESGEDEAAPDGTYGLVFEGRVGVANAAGEREFAREDAFFVADASTPPQLLATPPRFLRDPLEARRRREQQEARARATDVRREQLARAIASAQARGVDARPVAVIGATSSPIVVNELQDGSGNIALVGPGLGAGVGFATGAAALGFVDGGRGAVIQLDGERGRLDRFSFDGGLLQGDRGDAAVVDNGRIDGDGGAVWGRWLPGGAVRVGDQAAVPGTGVHFFFGNLTPESLFNVVPPGMSAVRYDLAGGPRPTDESGNAGQLLGGTFVVDFLHRSIGGNLSYRVENVGYNLPVPEGTPLVAGRGFVGFNVVGRGTGQWACPQCGTSGTLGHYSLAGLFLGSRAQGIGVAFGTQDAQLGRTAGTAIFRCVSGGCR
jgi:hypothetical protein